jgi:hypothetical protein
MTPDMDCTCSPPLQQRQHRLCGVMLVLVTRRKVHATQGGRASGEGAAGQLHSCRHHRLVRRGQA